MSVRINLGGWGSVFAVPSCIVDEHLKLASPQQLKVILFLLRNSEKSYTYKEIGDTLLIHEEDVKDSVTFWKERGVLADLEVERYEGVKLLGELMHERRLAHLPCSAQDEGHPRRLLLPPPQLGERHALIDLCHAGNSFFSAAKIRILSQS